MVGISAIHIFLVNGKADAQIIVGDGVWVAASATGCEFSSHAQAGKRREFNP